MINRWTITLRIIQGIGIMFLIGILGTMMQGISFWKGTEVWMLLISPLFFGILIHLFLEFDKNENAKRDTP